MAKNINITLTLQDKYSEKLSDAAKATLLFNKQLTAAKTVASGFKSIMGVMEKAAAGIAVGVAGAGAALAKEALSAYGEYEEALNRVAAVQGISAQTKEYEKLNEQIKETARNVQATTYTEAAEAAYYMSLAGWRDEEIEVAATPVLQAVKISEGDTKEVSDALTDSMTALGLSPKYAQEYADLATAVQSATNTDMLSLQNALIKDGAAYMASFSESAESDIDKVKDLMALTGVLASAGIKDTKAGTTIQSLLSRFYKSGNTEAQKGLEALGISMYDTEGNAKSMLSVFTEMDAALEGLSQAERNDALFKIGGTRYTSALNTIMDAFTAIGDDGVTAIEKVNEAMENADGAAERYLETLYSGYSGGLEQLSAEWENFKEDLGEIIAPYALEYIDRIRDNLPAALEFAEEKIPVIAEKIGELFETAKEGVMWLKDNGVSLLKALAAAYIGMGLFRGGVAAVDTVTKLSNFLKIGSGTGAAGNIIKILGGTAGTSAGTGSVLGGAIGNILGTGGAAAAGGSFSLGAVLAPAAVGITAAAGAGILAAGAIDGYKKYQDKKAKEEEKLKDETAKLRLATTDLVKLRKNEGGYTLNYEAAVENGTIGGEGSGGEGKTYGPFPTDEPGWTFPDLTDKDYEGSTSSAAAGGIGADIGIGDYLSAIGEMPGIFGDSFAIIFESLDNANANLENGKVEIKNTLDVISLGIVGAKEFLGAVIGTGVGFLAALVVSVGGLFRGIVGFLSGDETLTEGAAQGYVGSDGSVEWGGSGMNSPLQNDWSSQEADQAAAYEPQERQVYQHGSVYEYSTGTAESFDPAFYTYLRDGLEELSALTELTTGTEETLNTANETLDTANGTTDTANETLTTANETLSGVSETLTTADSTLAAANEVLAAARAIVEQINAQSTTEEHALGTNYFSGGRTSVNENGYEIMELPTGTRIIPHGKSRQIVEGNGSNGFIININIDNMYGEDERMVNRIGNTVAERLAMLM